MTVAKIMVVLHFVPLCILDCIWYIFCFMKLKKNIQISFHTYNITHTLTDKQTKNLKHQQPNTHTKCEKMKKM